MGNFRQMKNMKDTVHEAVEATGQVVSVNAIAVH